MLGAYAGAEDGLCETMKSQTMAEGKFIGNQRPQVQASQVLSLLPAPISNEGRFIMWRHLREVPLLNRKGTKGFAPIKTDTFH